MKKLKGLRKDVHGMDFESYTSRIISLSELYNIDDHDEKLTKPKKLTQMRFQIDQTEMKMVNFRKLTTKDIFQMEFCLYCLDIRF